MSPGTIRLYGSITWNPSRSRHDYMLSLCICSWHLRHHCDHCEHHHCVNTLINDMSFIQLDFSHLHPIFMNFSPLMFLIKTVLWFYLLQLKHCKLQKKTKNLSTFLDTKYIHSLVTSHNPSHFIIQFIAVTYIKKRSKQLVSLSRSCSPKAMVLMYINT